MNFDPNRKDGALPLVGIAKLFDSKEPARKSLKIERKSFTLAADVFARIQTGMHVDPALVAFLVDDAGVCRFESDFLFWNNMEVPGLKHMGDHGRVSFSGEEVIVTPDRLASHIAKVVFVLTTESSLSPGHRLDSLYGVCQLAVGAKADKVSSLFKVAERTKSTVLQLAVLEKANNDWQLTMDAQPLKGRLRSIIQSYGLAVEN